MSRFERSRLVVIALLTLAMVGCASRENMLLKDKSEKRVAVISLLGDKFEVYYRGVTAFGNKRKSIDINDIGVNEYVEERFSSSIQEKYGMKVVPVNVDRVGMAEKYAEHTLSLRGMYANPLDLKLEKIRPEISSIATSNNLDAVIIIAPAALYTGTTVEPEGMSLHSWGINDAVAGSYVNIFAGILVVDPETGRHVEYAQFKRPDSNGWPENPQDVRAMVSVKGTPLQDLAQRDVTDQDKQALSDILLTILDDELVDHTLKDALVKKTYEDY